MSGSVSLQVVLTFHQPLSAEASEISQVIRNHYVPLLNQLGSNPDARLALHFTGHLLDVMARQHEDVLFQIKALQENGQVEVLGGLFYGGPPALLPESDVRGQVEMMSEFWTSYLDAAPVGYWLPGYAWCLELPRLMQDSELRYSYVGADQVVGSYAHRGLGILQRGEEAVPVFAVDRWLSSQLPCHDIDPWVETLLSRTQGAGTRVQTVMIQAEKISEHLQEDPNWWERWLHEITEARADVKCVLPGTAFKHARPSVLWDWRPQGGEPVETASDAREYFLRRMYQVSTQLKEAIASMEEEGLEEEWSDELATAQRLLFAAQSPEPCGLHVSSVSPLNPRLRDAYMARLLEAAEQVDRLVQGDEDWISTEEEDRDFDMKDEIYVSTARLGVGLVPARGGEILNVDIRPWQRNVLESRAEHSSPAAATEADVGVPEDATVVDADREAPDEPMPIAAYPPAGIRAWVVEDGTSRPELESGSGLDLLAREPTWRESRRGISEEDYSFNLTMGSELDLVGREARRLWWERSVKVPIDASEIIFTHRARLYGTPAVNLLFQIPIRLSGPQTVTVDEEPWTGDEEAHDVQRVTVTGAESQRVTVSLSQPLTLWVSDHQEEGVVLTLVWRHAEGAPEEDEELRIVLEAE